VTRPAPIRHGSARHRGPGGRPDARARRRLRWGGEPVPPGPGACPYHRRGDRFPGMRPATPCGVRGDTYRLEGCWAPSAQICAPRPGH